MATVHDSALLMAISDATEGKRVLFITNDDSEADLLTKRATTLTLATFQKYANVSREEVFRYILPSKNSWQIQLRSNGWVLFCPSSLINPSEDMGNPSCVYVRVSPHTHERLTYMAWRTSLSKENDPQKPDDENATVWDRLMAGD